MRTLHGYREYLCATFHMHRPLLGKYLITYIGYIRLFWRTYFVMTFQVMLTRTAAVYHRDTLEPELLTWKSDSLEVSVTPATP